MTASPLQILSRATAEWASRPLTPEVEQATRDAVLDWFATTLPGCVQPPATLLAKAFTDEAGTGRAICYVTGTRMAPRMAALINGTASHIVEFDDIFRDGGYHPGSPTVAVALALSQHRGSTLEQFFRAVIGGYELGCRIAMALQPSHYRRWHITGTVGTFGSAAAAALMLGCNADQIAHAVALSTSFAGGHQGNLQGASMAKAMHPGHAAEAGMLAAYAAAQGATATPDALHGAAGYAAATGDDAGNWDAALEGLGKWTPITRMTVKNHGCCGHIFPAIDGLRHLRATHGFRPDDIATIQVFGYGPTKSICDNPNPKSAQEARFSLHYCLAADLVLGGVRLAAFSPEALADPRLRAIMTSITVDRDEDIAAAYPRRRMARLRVTLTNGQVLEHFQQTRKGDPDDPLTPEERLAKFDELAAAVVSAPIAERLQRDVLTGAEVPQEVPLDRA